MRFLILFIFLTTNVFANDVSQIKNIVIHKDLKVYDNVIFLDKNDKEILGIKNLVWIDKCCYLKYSNPPSKATANDGFI